MSQVGFELQIPFQQYDTVHSLYVVATVINIVYECLCYHTQEIPVTPQTHVDFFLVAICITGNKIYSDLTTHLTDRYVKTQNIYFKQVWDKGNLCI
jgi:hypothetical protein